MLLSRFIILAVEAGLRCSAAEGRKADVIARGASPKEASVSRHYNEHVGVFTPQFERGVKEALPIYDGRNRFGDNYAGNPFLQRRNRYESRHRRL